MLALPCLPILQAASVSELVLPVEQHFLTLHEALSAALPRSVLEGDGLS